jgi:rsbT co-antagonist protein RsbR
MTAADQPPAAGGTAVPSFDAIAFLSASNDPCVVYDTNRRFVFANRMAASLVGLAPADMLGKTPADLHGDHAEDIDRHIAQVLATGEAVTVVHRIRAGDGRELDLKESFTPVRDAAGAVAWVVGVGRDVTETREVIAKLAEREELFRLLADTVADVFWMLDFEQGRMIYINPAYETLWGRPRDAIYADRMEFARAIHPEDRERVVASLPLQVRGDYAIEYRIVRPDGTLRWLRTRTFPVPDASGRARRVVGLATDITAQKESEQIIRDQAAALRAMSTPLMPIHEGVLVMPIVGLMDEQRAQQLLLTLLDGVVQHAAEVVILDVTGTLGVVDSAVTNVLVSATRAARLLGARVVVTGLGPEMARGIIDLGLDMSEMVTRSTLEAGIRHALAVLGPR